MRYIDGYDPDNSFWSVFPEFRAAGYFKPVYKKDQSKNKHRSSKLMWFLVLAFDIDSQFYKLDEAEKMELLTEDLEFDPVKFVGGEDNWRITIKAFTDAIDTALSRAVRINEAKLLERARFIDETPYSLDKMVYPNKEEGESFKPYKHSGTAKDLDTMVTGTGKIIEDVKKQRAMLAQEGEAVARGGTEVSATDNGVI